MEVTGFRHPQNLNAFGNTLARIGSPWRFQEHCHDGFMELVYVYEGEFTHTVAGTPVRQRKGELLLVRDFDGHMLAGENFVFSNLQVPNRWLRQIERLWDAPGLLAAPLARPAPLLAQLSPVERRHYEHGLESLSRPPQAEGRVALFSSFFLDTLLRYFVDPSRFGISREQLPDWLEQTLTWIHQRRGQPIAVTDIVEHARKCPEHLARSFRKHLGLTPSQYLNRQRLEHAAELLASTNYPLLEVCYSAGFDHPSYFHRLFKQIYNQTPAAYRKANYRAG